MWGINNQKLKLYDYSVIYITNFVKFCKNNDALFAMVSEIGEISACYILTSQKFKQIAYVEYIDSYDAISACNYIEDKYGGQVNVGILTGMGDSDVKLYVKNLAANINNQMLRLIFEPHGKVEVAYVKYDEEGESLGFGFVTFESKDDAAEAIRVLDGKTFNGKTLKVSYCQSIHHRSAYLLAVHENLIDFSEPSGISTIDISSFKSYELVASTSIDDIHFDVVKESPQDIEPDFSKASGEHATQTTNTGTIPKTQVVEPGLKLNIPQNEGLSYDSYVEPSANEASVPMTEEKQLLKELLTKRVEVECQTYVDAIVQALMTRSTSVLNKIIRDPKMLKHLVNNELLNISFDKSQEACDNYYP